MKWSDQYKHPNWQKKRLETLERAGFTCEMCGDSESQLHVHHKRYVKGRAIWEYSADELSVLCEPCHGRAHEVKEQMQSLLARIHAEGAVDVLAVLAGYANNACGPAAANATDAIDFVEHPFAVLVGRLAALADRRLDIGTTAAVCEFLEHAEPGASMTLTIPVRKHFDLDWKS